VYRIINLFELFQNPYNGHGWQVWKIDPAGGSDLIGVFRTRSDARIAVGACKAARYITGTA